MVWKNAERPYMKQKYRNSKENCPHCGIELQGGPIPKSQWSMFGATHWSRKISFYDSLKDRTTKWICPDCSKEWADE